MFGALKVSGLKPPQVVLKESVLGGSRNGDSHDGEGCRLVASGTRRKDPAPSADLQLRNRVRALAAMSTRAGTAPSSTRRVRASGETNTGTAGGTMQKAVHRKVHTSTVLHVSKSL